MLTRGYLFFFLLVSVGWLGAGGARSAEVVDEGCPVVEMKQLKPRMLRSEAKRVYPNYFGLHLCPVTGPSDSIAPVYLVGDIVEASGVRYFHFLPLTSEPEALHQSEYLRKISKHNPDEAVLENFSAICIDPGNCERQNSSGFIKVVRVNTESFPAVGRLLQNFDQNFWNSVGNDGDKRSLVGDFTPDSSAIMLTGVDGYPAKGASQGPFLVYGKVADKKRSGNTWAAVVRKVNGDFRIVRLNPIIE